MEKVDARFFSFEPVKGARYRYDYAAIAESLNEAKMDDDIPAALKILKAGGRMDMFFLGYFLLGLTFINHPWLIERVYEIQDQYDMTMDLWAREHLKSTGKSFILPIFIILNDPERRILWLSHTRTASKAFMFKVMMELQSNVLLKHTYPEILWMRPEYDAPKWSLDEGATVRRRGNYLEATFEAYGLSEKLPTGKHFTDLIVDDPVDKDSVSNDEQRKKTLDMFRHALNLVSDLPGQAPSRKTIQGTPYHYADLYSVLEEEGVFKVRKRPATADGTKDGEPVLWTKNVFLTKWATMGSSVASAQLLMKPTSDDNAKFSIDHLRYFSTTPKDKLTVALLVDPASEERRDKCDPDYTVFVVIGVDQFYNRYLLDGRRDRLKVGGKWKWFKHYYLKYSPQVIGYEKYGAQTDLQYFEERCVIEGFPSVPQRIMRLGGKVAKSDRIMTLQPNFENHMFFLPHRIDYVREGEKIARNFVQEFIDKEFKTYPNSVHDDILDAMARINDPDLGLVVPEKVMADMVSKGYSPLDEIDFGGGRRAWVTM